MTPSAFKLNTTTHRPASFWARALAWLLDAGLLTLLLGGGLLAWAGLNIHYHGNEAEPPLSFMIPAVLACLLGPWLYAATLESGRAQATLGQRALGLQVVNAQGQRPNFAQASGRWVIRFFLSNGSLGAAYAMAWFHPQGQTLHDLLSATQVCAQAQRGPRALPILAMLGGLVLLLVLMLGLAVAAISIPIWQGVQQLERTEAIFEQLEQTRQAYDAYVAAHEQMPDSLEAVRVARANEMQGFNLSLRQHPERLVASFSLDADQPARFISLVKAGESWQCLTNLAPSQTPKGMEHCHPAENDQQANPSSPP